MEAANFKGPGVSKAAPGQKRANWTWANLLLGELLFVVLNGNQKRKSPHFRVHSAGTAEMGTFGAEASLYRRDGFATDTEDWTGLVSPGDMRVRPPPFPMV